MFINNSLLLGKEQHHKEKSSLKCSAKETRKTEEVWNIQKIWKEKNSDVNESGEVKIAPLHKTNKEIGQKCQNQLLQNWKLINQRLTTNHGC